MHFDFVVKGAKYDRRCNWEGDWHQSYSIQPTIWLCVKSGTSTILEMYFREDFVKITVCQSVRIKTKLIMYRGWTSILRVDSPRRGRVEREFKVLNSSSVDDIALEPTSHIGSFRGSGYIARVTCIALPDCCTSHKTLLGTRKEFLCCELLDAVPNLEHGIPLENHMCKNTEQLSQNFNCEQTIALHQTPHAMKHHTWSVWRNPRYLPNLSLSCLLWFDTVHRPTIIINTLSLGAVSQEAFGATLFCWTDTSKAHFFANFCSLRQQIHHRSNAHLDQYSSASRVTCVATELHKTPRNIIE